MTTPRQRPVSLTYKKSTIEHIEEINKEQGRGEGAGFAETDMSVLPLP